MIDESYFDKSRYYEIAQKVASKYQDRTSMAFGLALNAMDVGFERMVKNPTIRADIEREPRMIKVYLTWYMKTAIEVELGYDNEDTRAWKRNGFDKYVKEAAQNGGSD